MSVLQVTPRYPPQTGGVETHVEELSERLVERGHDVTVVSADAGASGERRENRDGVRVRRFRALAPGENVHIAPGIARFVRLTDADVVHAHNYHSLPLLFAALGVDDERFVVTPHYHGRSAGRVRNLLLRSYRPLGSMALDRADRIIAVSDWEREQLEADFGHETTVVRNGIDLERFANPSQSRRGRPYLLCVCRLEAYKGVHHVLKALPHLAEYDLVVAGDGPFRSQLERLAREFGVRERTEFLGYVDDDRLSDLYGSAAVHLVLSSFESYGLTVGESLAAGTPCVVRMAGGLRSWAEAPGVVPVEATEPESIAAAVDAATGLSTAPETLTTWDEVAEAVEACYECGIAGRDS